MEVVEIAVQSVKLSDLTGDEPRKNGQIEQYDLVTFEGGQVCELNQAIIGNIEIGAQLIDAFRVCEVNASDVGLACLRGRKWLVIGRDRSR